LFWILAGIEFAWSAIGMAFKGDDLGEWLVELLNQIIFIGFFSPAVDLLRRLGVADRR
jgi:type IV secretion system protein TrbL